MTCVLGVISHFAECHPNQLNVLVNFAVGIQRTFWLCVIHLGDRPPLWIQIHIDACQDCGSDRPVMSTDVSVAQTGVPWSTAERYRQMYEVVNEYKIEPDKFLVLCEEGANIAEIKGALKEAFKGAISTVIPRIASLDVTNSKEVADLADDLNQLIPASMVTADLETLNGELAELLAELPQKQSAEQSADIAEAIHQKRTEIGESYAKPMKALVSALAPFVNWSPQQVKDYMTAFADQPLSQKTRLYNEATTLAKNVATGIAIAKKAGA